MKRLLAAGVAAAALTITGIGTAPVASAKTSHSDVSAASCPTYWLKALDNVKIRKSKKIKATALGVLPKGKRVCWDESETGGTYHFKGACRTGYGSNNWWYRIAYKPKNHAKIVGWVPRDCMDWY
ncbi:hypothetical protein [Actinoallomurus rhizosphaericola]|uniref:hypothetical protein n=1 Tax=Actinoallomurus rhizosphaericola TaxID=2952536 RepID=UPI0020925BAC|nr:hypothetical protein [Actinoallomurus rhizosphaericola]MCO5998722.1 hypothetical protein [Actinoallomurus rhizosphaericola]